jgi:hypothetical protein
LKIVLVDADPLQAELVLRWQTFSDQGLQIQSMTKRDVSAQDVSTVDVMIYPANLMGTLIARDWIAPVPNQLREQIGGWEGPSGSDGIASENADEIDRAKSVPWPSRWRALSTFGGKPMAVPLGAPSWIAVTRSLDISPLTKLHSELSGNQLAPGASSKFWDEFLSTAELELQGSQAQRERELMERIESLGAQEKRSLANRYLWLVSSTEARYRGLFDMYKMLSRWNQSEFAKAALHLRRLAVLQPSTIFASPTDAWDSVVEGKAVFGLGWPRTDNEQRFSGGESLQPLQLIPIIWNDGSGLMASMGRRTRQSANAADFLVWLGSEGQRAAFQAKTATVELVEIDQDRNRVREDYRDYQTLQRLESGGISLELTPRFYESDRFLGILEEALVDVLRSPENADSRLARCREEWNLLVEELGREGLRSSLEAAIGYSR